jgi:hypothetical protein
LSLEIVGVNVDDDPVVVVLVVDVVSVVVDAGVVSVVVVSVVPDDDVAVVSVAAAVVSVLPEDVPGTPLSASATDASSPATRRAPNPSAIRPRRISCQRLFISFALFLILRAMP